LKINLIIERLLIYFNVETNAALAQKLGVSATTLSNWKNRNTMDYELVFTKCEGANLNWIFFGQGNMSGLPDQINESPPRYGKVVYDAQEKIIQSQRETIDVQSDYINSLKKDLAKLQEEKEPVDDGQKRKAV
jgi:hypothetical protein